MKIKEFLEEMENGNIRDSEIQRQEIWSKKFKTDLVESILKGKPTGVITIFKQDNNNFKEVIDGKQRIKAIQAFVDNDISYDEKFIDQVDTEAFLNYELNIQESSGTFEDKVELFEKINKNIVLLSQFELLHALHYGDFLEELSDFVEINEIASVLGVNTRGANEMLILGLIKGNINVNTFLEQNKDEHFIKFEKIPREIFSFINDVFKNKKKNLPILIELAKTYKSHQKELKEKKDKLAYDLQWMLDSLHVENWDKLSAYERILDRYITSKDPQRFFPPDYKITLWKDVENICPLCAQEIKNIEDAEMDHIKPWSKGGKTELKNCQLTHQQCNRKKGNKERV